MTTLLMFESVRFHSLAELSFSAGEGEALVLTLSDSSLDRNILPLLTGLVLPDSGTVTLLGIETADPSIRTVRSRIGIFPGTGGLVSNLKAVENVMLILGYHQKMARRRAFETACSLLEQVGYRGDPGALPAHLSPMDARRVSLARSIAARPLLMVWKDAEIGLSPEEAAEICSAFFLLPSEHPGTSRLCISREPELFQPFADRIVYG